MRYFTQTYLDVTRFVLDRAQNVMVSTMGPIGRIGPISIVNYSLSNPIDIEIHFKLDEGPNERAILHAR